MVRIVIYSSSPSHQKPELSSSHWWPFRHHVSGATKEMRGCGSPSFPSSSWPWCPPWGLVGGVGVPLHLHMGHGVLSVQIKNDLFTSSFWKTEKISGDILILFYAELFLDGAAASHVKRFVSFEFSLNCIISISAPWNIRAVLFVESLIISRGLLS